ncbi:zinc ribbon domain-containing protein [Aliarcobacter lanthieri]|uniref:zinc ribbon domain-containing protein n=1 Tax=Aliarcobacter lanthieri TaxID=1355374 RepID=UPI00047CAFBF|nr:zinc ribbon domain-containing protein [Aliarcobacter lanthieri]QKF58865.1 putative membrane protein [Aliarcobacter lanthieri]
MKNFIKKFYKNNFVYGTKEKLSKITILAILVLNLIVYYILVEGISFQTNFVNHPSQVFSSSCSNAIRGDLKSFNSYVYSKNYSIQSDYYYSRYDKYKRNNELLDNRCKELSILIKNIKDEFDIEELIKKDRDLAREEYNIEEQISYIKNNYNTVLFEKIATQDSDKSIIKNNINSENIKENYENNLKILENIKQQRTELLNSFENSKSIQSLFSYVNNIKENYLKDEEDTYKMYYYKIDIVTLLFLLPMLLIFFYLMKRFIKNEKYILYIVFKNLLIVTLIPTLYTIFMIIYKFLPKVFIAKLIEFFYNIEIPFVVYYLLIVVFVVIFVFIIIKIQKRFKESNEKLKDNKITKIESYNKNICNNCANRVDYNVMNYCPCCQHQLKIECENCHKSSIKGLEYCLNCGINVGK